MVLGIIIGASVGIWIGIIAGTMFKGSVNEDLINDLKGYRDYWYDRCVKSEKAFYDLLDMYTKELTKQLDKK